MYNNLISLIRSRNGFKIITAIVYKVCSFSFYFILFIILYFYEFGMSVFHRIKKESEGKGTENG